MNHIKTKYHSTQCKKCGEYIGGLGRFNDLMYGLIGIKNITHKCINKKYEKIESI